MVHIMAEEITSYITVVHIHPNPSIRPRKSVYSFTCVQGCHDVQGSQTINLNLKRTWAGAYPVRINGSYINPFGGNETRTISACQSQSFYIEYDYVQGTYLASCNSPRKYYVESDGTWTDRGGVTPYEAYAIFSPHRSRDGKTMKAELDIDPETGWYIGSTAQVSYRGSTPVAGIALDTGVMPKGWSAQLLYQMDSSSTIMIGEQQCQGSNCTTTRYYYTWDDQGNRVRVPYTISGPANRCYGVVSNITFSPVLVYDPESIDKFRPKGTGTLVIQTTYEDDVVEGAGLVCLDQRASLKDSTCSALLTEGSHSILAFKNYNNYLLYGQGGGTVIKNKRSFLEIPLQEVVVTKHKIIGCIEMTWINDDGTTESGYVKVPWEFRVKALVTAGHGGSFVDKEGIDINPTGDSVYTGISQSTDQASEPVFGEVTDPYLKAQLEKYQFDILDILAKTTAGLHFVIGMSVECILFTLGGGEIGWAGKAVKTPQFLLGRFLLSKGNSPSLALGVLKRTAFPMNLKYQVIETLRPTTIDRIVSIGGLPITVAMGVHSVFSGITYKIAKESLEPWGDDAEYVLYSIVSTSISGEKSFDITPPRIQILKDSDQEVEITIRRRLITVDGKKYVAEDPVGMVALCTKVGGQRLTEYDKTLTRVDDNTFTFTLDANSGPTGIGFTVSSSGWSPVTEGISYVGISESSSFLDDDIEYSGIAETEDVQSYVADDGYIYGLAVFQLSAPSDEELPKEEAEEPEDKVDDGNGDEYPGNDPGTSNGGGGGYGGPVVPGEGCYFKTKRGGGGEDDIPPDPPAPPNDDDGVLPIIPPTEPEEPEVPSFTYKIVSRAVVVQPGNLPRVFSLYIISSRSVAISEGSTVDVYIQNNRLVYDGVIYESKNPMAASCFGPDGSSVGGGYTFIRREGEGTIMRITGGSAPSGSKYVIDGSVVITNPEPEEPEYGWIFVQVKPDGIYSSIELVGYGTQPGPLYKFQVIPGNYNVNVKSLTDPYTDINGLGAHVTAGEVTTLNVVLPVRTRVTFHLNFTYPGSKLRINGVLQGGTFNPEFTMTVQVTSPIWYNFVFCKIVSGTTHTGSASIYIDPRTCPSDIYRSVDQHKISIGGSTC